MVQQGRMVNDPQGPVRRACQFLKDVLGGVLRRAVVRQNVEGIKTTCPQGCCVTWQSKTLLTNELETLRWNGTTHAAERQTFQKWYVTQYGDGLMSIAQKVFGVLIITPASPSRCNRVRAHEKPCVFISREKNARFTGNSFSASALNMPQFRRRSSTSVN